MNVKVSVSSCSSCFWFKFGVVKVYWVSILQLFGGGDEPCQFPHLHTICCRVPLGKPSLKKTIFLLTFVSKDFFLFFLMKASLTFICRLRTSILPCKILYFILTSRTLQCIKSHLYYFYLWCVGCGRPATLQSVVVIQTVMSCNVMTEFNHESVFVRNCICKENGYLLPFSTCSSLRTLVQP